MDKEKPKGAGGPRGRPKSAKNKVPASAAASAAAPTAAAGSQAAAVPMDLTGGKGPDGDNVNMPRDAQVIAHLLHSQGIEDYQPRVINQLLEFQYRTEPVAANCEHTSTIADALRVALPCHHDRVYEGSPSGRTIVSPARRSIVSERHTYPAAVVLTGEPRCCRDLELSDVKLAIQLHSQRSFTQPPPLQVALSLF